MAKRERIPTLADRKRMLVEAIQNCDSPRTISELEAVLINHAVRELTPISERIER